jgi:cobalt-zinc-cadmium efflux system outer membrane protein
VRAALVAAILSLATPPGVGWAQPGVGPDQPGVEPSSPGPSTLPAQLSLADALRVFRERGFDLLLADAAVASASGDLAIAKALPNPVVGGGGGRSFTYDPGKCDHSGCSRTPWNANLSDQGLLVDLLVGKRRLKVDVAKAALEAARLSRADAERTLTALVKQQYVQVVLARAALGFASEQAAAAAQTASLVALRFKAGDVSEADSARAETQKLEAERAVDAAQQALALAKASLAFLLGVREASPAFDVDPQLPPSTPPGSLAGATADSLLAQAREKRPDLAAARAQLASAEATVALAKRQRFPDVALVGGYQQEGHGQEAIQPPTATIGVSLPLPVFYRNGGEITKAEAALRTQTVQREKLDAQVASDVASAFAAYQSAAARVQRMESRGLDRARRARDLVEYQYKRGAASLLELLDAQRTFVATNAEYYQDMSDYWTAFYQLEEAVGVELGP